MSNIKLVLNETNKTEIRIKGYQLPGNMNYIFIKPESLYFILQDNNITNMEKGVLDYYKICVKSEWNEYNIDDRIIFPYTDDEIKTCIDYITISDKDGIKSTLEKMGFNNDEFKGGLMFVYNKYNDGVHSLSTDDIKTLTSLITLVMSREYGFRFKYDGGIQSLIPLDIEHLRENIEYYFKGTWLDGVDTIDIKVTEWSQTDFDIDPYKAGEEMDVELVSEYYFNTLLLKIKGIKKNVELKEKVRIKLENNYKKWLSLPVDTKEQIKTKLYIATAMYCDSLLHAECLDDYEPAHIDYVKECAKILNIKFNDDELYGEELRHVHNKLFEDISWEYNFTLSDYTLDYNGLRIMDLFMK